MYHEKVNNPTVSVFTIKVLPDHLLVIRQPIVTLDISRPCGVQDLF